MAIIHSLLPLGV
ncbi:hypothetical protein CGCTS75_v004472 [Colletotrichum tropicale]|nr:hypothetical protein CGCTS75_v004472 [Colletotrichum tropicale]